VRNRGPTKNNKAPFVSAGFWGLVCLVYLAVLQCTTEPLFSQLVTWWLRDFIYLTAPVAVGSMIMYRSSWHREFAPGKRVLVVAFSSFITLVMGLFMVGFVIGVLLLFAYGPPTLSHIPNEYERYMPAIWR
jgi:hypothetical protein